MERRRRFKEVEIIGMPVEFGGSLRGVGLAPTAFRLGGLADKIEAEGFRVRDAGDLHVAAHTPVGRRRPRLADLERVYRGLAERVGQALRGRRLPIVLGGDHSIAIGTLAGVARHFRDRDERLGVLWIDAHGDMNTLESSPSGNIHGMPLAISLGEGIPSLVRLLGFAPKVDAARCALVGVRNLDEREKVNIARLGVKVFTMKDIDRRGLAVVVEEAIQVAAQGSDGVHVSFDMDVIDPTIAPGVGTAVPGGLSYREAHLVMELISDSRAMAALEVVEANPILDNANATVRLGTELILSALGKSIY